VILEAIDPAARRIESRHLSHGDQQISAAPLKFNVARWFLRRWTWRIEVGVCGAAVDAAKATGAGHAIIVPELLAAGYHQCDRCPEMLRARWALLPYHNVNRSATYTTSITPSPPPEDTSLTLNFSGGSTYLLVAVAEVAGLDPARRWIIRLQNHSRHRRVVVRRSHTTQPTNICFPGLPQSRECNVLESREWMDDLRVRPIRRRYACWTRGLGHRIVSASVTPSTAQNYAMEIVTFK